MIVDDFTKVAMGALFGELAGYDNVKGISHLALGQGLESWDSGTVPDVVASESGLYLENLRKKVEEVLFLQNIEIPESGTVIYSSSGFQASIYSVFGLIPNYHLNGLTCTITSGTGTYSRVIESFDSGTEIVLLSEYINDMSSGTLSFSVQDVICPAGRITTDSLYKFSFNNGEFNRSIVREEGLIGAGSTDEGKTGYNATIERYRGILVGGKEIDFHRKVKMSISSGIYIR